MENKHTRSVSLIDGHTEEMTDAEVIKALECHIKRHCWDDCPNAREEIQLLDKPCSQKIAEDALDLINRKDAEIERLNGLLIENEKAFNKMTELYNKAFNRCKTAKSEAIKEFAERLCEGRVSNDPVVIAVKTELKMTEVKENG